MTEYENIAFNLMERIEKHLLTASKNMRSAKMLVRAYTKLSEINPEDLCQKSHDRYHRVTARVKKFLDENPRTIQRIQSQEREKEWKKIPGYEPEKPKPKVSDQILDLGNGFTYEKKYGRDGYIIYNGQKIIARHKLLINPDKITNIDFDTNEYIQIRTSDNQLIILRKSVSELTSYAISSKHDLSRNSDGFLGFGLGSNYIKPRGAAKKPVQKTPQQQLSELKLALDNLYRQAKLYADRKATVAQLRETKRDEFLTLPLNRERLVKITREIEQITKELTIENSATVFDAYMIAHNFARHAVTVPRTAHAI